MICLYTVLCRAQWYTLLCGENALLGGQAQLGPNETGGETSKGEEKLAVLLS